MEMLVIKSKYKKIRINDRVIDEHRHVMEQHLGRKLSRNELVHHKDEDKSNNDISNLEILSRKKHTSLHRTGQIISEEHKQKTSDTLQGITYPERRKFTNEEIRYIREIAVTKEVSLRSLTKKFNVVWGTIYDIVHRHSYKDI